MGIDELTVPSEERIQVAGELKRTKYAGLKEEGRKMDGQSRCGPSRWDAADSLQRRWQVSSEKRGSEEAKQ